MPVCLLVLCTPYHFIGSSERVKVKAHSRIEPVSWILLRCEGKYLRPCNVMPLLLSLTDVNAHWGILIDCISLYSLYTFQGSVKRKLICLRSRDHGEKNELNRGRDLNAIKV